MKNNKEYVRTNIYLTKEQVIRLDNVVDQTGATRAELIRRAIDYTLNASDRDKGASIENFKRYKESKEGE